MSNRFDLRRARLAGIALAMLAVFALPAAAQAAPVGLGTAEPLRGPRRHQGHQHRAVGAQRRPRRLAGHRTRQASACPPWSTAPRTQPTESPPRRSSISPPPTTSPRDSRCCRRTTSPARTWAKGNSAPGTYRYNAAALLTGALTLDAEGDPNAAFVFQIGSQLTTASASSVVLVNGASPVQRLLAGRQLGRRSAPPPRSRAT